ETHEHIGLIYWARPKSGSLALAAAEHHDIRWCSVADLETLEPAMNSSVKWYCLKAITEISAHGIDAKPAESSRRNDAVDRAQLRRACRLGYYRQRTLASLRLREGSHLSNDSSSVEIWVFHFDGPQHARHVLLSQLPV